MISEICEVFGVAFMGSQVSKYVITYVKVEKVEQQTCSK